MSKTDLFLDSKMEQFGSHMLITNVNKPNKTKYLNIDTRFCEDYNYSSNASFNISIPERITNAKSISLTNIEIPFCFYNISESKGNNYFKLTDITNQMVYMITVSGYQYIATNPTGGGDGSYKTLGFFDVLNTALSNTLPMNTNLSVNYSISPLTTGGINLNNTGIISLNTQITNNTSNTYLFDFAVDKTGSPDKRNMKFKLGWLLGFRSPSYTVTAGTSMISEGLYDFNGTRYLYLALDEFSKGYQNSFLTPLHHSIINKNILARITVYGTYEYNIILTANNLNGQLLSDVRKYNGNVDLQRFQISLLDEAGNVISLNGGDFSFLLKVDYE
jgi:hypothetical protein